jgi:hypothetical protein
MRNIVDLPYGGSVSTDNRGNYEIVERWPDGDRVRIQLTPDISSFALLALLQDRLCTLQFSTKGGMRETWADGAYAGVATALFNIQAAETRSASPVSEETTTK